MTTKTLRFLLKGLPAVLQPYLELDHIGQMPVKNSRHRFGTQTANPHTSSSLFQLLISSGQTFTNICQLLLGHLLKTSKKHIVEEWPISIITLQFVEQAQCNIF